MPLTRFLLSVLVLLLFVLPSVPIFSETPEEQIGQALKRSLERSDYATKRRAAELRDVSDAEWEGFRMPLSLQEWRERLTAEQFRSTRDKIADQPGAEGDAHASEEGVFHCACGNPLFHTHHRSESADGHPTFLQPVAPDAVVTDLGSDWSRENEQVELLCSVCEAHLGHVDPGESPEDDLSFVVNASALVFEASESSSASDR